MTDSNKISVDDIIEMLKNADSNNELDEIEITLKSNKSLSSTKSYDEDDEEEEKDDKVLSQLLLTSVSHYCQIAQTVQEVKDFTEELQKVLADYEHPMAVILKSVLLVADKNKDKQEMLELLEKFIQILSDKLHN